jgi:hypothetical protein
MTKKLQAFFHMLCQHAKQKMNKFLLRLTQVFCHIMFVEVYF